MSLGREKIVLKLFSNGSTKAYSAIPRASVTPARTHWRQGRYRDQNGVSHFHLLHEEFPAGSRIGVEVFFNPLLSVRNRLRILLEES